MMVCPKCGGKVGVVDTKTSSGNNVYRRRYCKDCFHAFFTVERQIPDTPEFRVIWQKLHPKTADHEKRQERIEKRLQYLKEKGEII